MKGVPENQPFENLVVTENVRSLLGFNLPQLKYAITDIIELEAGDGALGFEAPMFNLFGADLALAFDGDELIYDLGASNPTCRSAL